MGLCATVCATEFRQPPRADCLAEGCAQCSAHRLCFLIPPFSESVVDAGDLHRRTCLGLRVSTGAESVRPGHIAFANDVGYRLYAPNVSFESSADRF